MKENIIVYSNGCPKCQILEAKLGAKKIKYDRIKDINVSEIQDKGFHSLPIMSINGEYMDFFKANEWVNAQS